MALSKIEITFVSIPAVDTVLNFTDSLTGIAMTETFKASRTQIGESELKSSTSSTANSYTQAFNTDYNNTLLYTVLYDIANLKVIITATNASSQFTLNSNTTAGAITTVITNGTIVTPFTIDALSVSADVGNECSNVQISVTTNVQSDSITSPVIGVVSSNPHVFTTPRADSIKVSMVDTTGSADKTVRIPLLLSAYIDIDIVNTPSGATVTVNRLYPLSDLGGFPLQLTFQYSLDGLLWQTSNSWSGIAIGSQTLYIKDNIGCQISIPFTVDAFTANLVDFDPVGEISNANSFAFKINETITNCGIRHNMDNSLSYEENTKINRRDYTQLFQQCDTIKTQIKSNYGTVTAKIVDFSGVETALSVTKVTSNMNITDIRDGKVLTLPSGLLGVYFGSGNTYDPITSIQNGSYNLLESLMSWVNEGDYINVEGIGWSLVTNIIAPTSTFGFYIAELATQNTLGYADNTIVKITTIYNLVDFERYEFTIDFSTYSGCYQITVNLTDTSFPDKEFISEWVNIKTEQPEHHLIKYYSTKNNEINYGTGITNLLRLPYVIGLQWKPNDEQEIYVTDTKTVNLDSKVREFYQLDLMPLPSRMAKKVVLVLAHNRIFIDGINYLLEGEVESKPLGTTNLYSIKANLVKSNYVFSNTQGITSAEVIANSGIPLSIDQNASGLLFIE